MKKWLAAVLVAAIGAGCIPSFHALCTEEQTLTEDRILGRWEGNDEDGAWEFARESGKIYQVTYIDEEGNRGPFDGCLTRIGDQLYLDLFPGEAPFFEDVNQFYLFHMPPMHTFLRVTVSEDRFTIQYMDPDRIEELVEEEGAKLRFEKRDDGLLLLTASTAELRAFVEKHQGDKELFDDPGEYTRAESDAEPEEEEEAESKAGMATGEEE